ncbi:NUDIX domain-containing protein [Actinokineospora sp. PR83]|uniref:NUDIX domain-containing protein n=1 Tax=Actinokineospora sp. PR83 TaxID=2884908 RepID=UPI0027E06FAC|nr:NUDIX domain-containing protein [Actinokineospora sp. PR83]MCG8914261.1 NUDIX domain-containing protein [Actinokineospora sp. PR83]
MRGDGDRVVRCGLGHVHWGRHGAAGLLPVHRPDGGEAHVLLQQRALWTPGGGTWGTFGGARDSHEDAVTAALRETAEESTLDLDLVRPFGTRVVDHGGWAYTTVLAVASAMPRVRPGSNETRAAAWVPVPGVTARKLFAPFAASWTELMDELVPPVLIVDCANVMGSRPDGWWRDRAGAATRLRDGLAEVVRAGVADFAGLDTAYPEAVLVVEGRARGIGSVDGVTVVDSPGEGDDTIVEQARAHAGGPCFMVTADRELRARCAAEGAEVLGPRWLLDRLG